MNKSVFFASVSIVLCACVPQNFREKIRVEDLNYSFYAPKTKIETIRKSGPYKKGKELDIRFFKVSATDMIDGQLELVAAEVAQQEGYDKLIITQKSTAGACETYEDYSYYRPTQTFYQNKRKLCSNHSTVEFLSFNDYTPIKNGIISSSSDYEKKQDRGWLFHDLYIPMHEDPNSTTTSNGTTIVRSKKNDAYKAYYDVSKMAEEYREDLGEFETSYIYTPIIRETKVKTHGLIEEE